MNVLSLFDGMSCGRIALERAGVNIDKYYASEIKPHAIAVTMHNYPDTIQVGDVTKIDFTNYTNIDLLIGGSPCQDFSRGNKERKGLDGIKSSLFYKWLEARETINPRYFLLENVVMDIEDNNYITSLLGVQPVRINSSLVSPQMRDRYYWTNIPGLEDDLFGKIIGQPKDKKINLSDVIDEGYTPMKKARCLLESDSRPLTTPVKMFHRFYSTGFTTLVFKDENHYRECVRHYEKNYKGLSTDKFIKDNSVYEGVRYLNQIELEQCQTVPLGYTSILSRNDAACLLGDGWTVDVIAHIFKGLRRLH